MHQQLWTRKRAPLLSNPQKKLVKPFPDRLTILEIFHLPKIVHRSESIEHVSEYSQSMCQPTNKHGSFAGSLPSKQSLKKIK